MAKMIHVAIGSTASKPGDVSGNLAQIEDFARRAGDDGADVLLTPELSASGYGGYPEVIATVEPAGKGPIFDRLAALAEETGVVLAAGFAERGEQVNYLSHYVVRPDGRFVVQRKHRVTHAETPLESPVEQIPEPGEKDPAIKGQPVETNFEVFEIASVRCVLHICADSGIRDIESMHKWPDVELRLCPAGAGGLREHHVTTAELRTPEGREKYASQLEHVFYAKGAVLRCLATGTGVAAVNQCGFDGKEKYHWGHGMIINAMGEFEALIPGLVNLDRQRPMYAHGEVDVSRTVWNEQVR